MMVISLCFVVVGVVLLVFNYVIVMFNTNNLRKRKNGGKYCILIPARDESKVIENLLISIENQSRKIDSKDVYVITESKKDPTVDIVLKYKMNIVIRKDLNKRRKGYALDDAIKKILGKKLHYDAYFIFDADNILDVDYIKEMEKSINLGYDIGIGYRNTKNSDNLVSAASALTFSMINTVFNDRKNKYHNNLTISGTGYYIRGYLVEKWKGFIFHSLTEDYEFTLYSVLHNLTSTYNKKAIFYDEQPTDFKVSIKQRTRWVKGYFEARGKYIGKIRRSLGEGNFASKMYEIIGVWPFILIIIGLLIYLVNLWITKSPSYFLINLGIILLVVYLSLIIFTGVMLKKEVKLKMDLSMKIKVLFYNPLFLASYVWCLILSIFNNNVGWDKINHDIN